MGGMMDLLYVLVNVSHILALVALAYLVIHQARSIRLICEVLREMAARLPARYVHMRSPRVHPQAADGRPFDREGN